MQYKLNMYRINTFNLILDFRDFLKSNRKTLVVIIIVNLLALILGIRAAFAVCDAGVYLYAHPTNVFKLLTDKTSIFGYFFISLITYITVLTLIVLSSVNFLLSYLALAVLFFRSYLFSLHLCLYIMFLKLSVLPFAIVCLIPCYIVSMFLFSAVAILSINRARDARLYGAGCGNSFPLYMQKMIIPATMLVILTVLCAVLSYFLTLGIIL